MSARKSRRELLASAAWLALLAGCSRLQPGPAASTPAPAPTPSPTATPTPSPTPTPDPFPPITLPDGNINVLIAGSDSRSADLNDNARSDVICLAQLSADRSLINLVSIARDTLATMPGASPSKINDAYAIGGVQLLADVVAEMLGGLPIHFTLETGFIWFTELSALMGGFTVDNRIASDSFGADFPAGPVELSGDPALIYARERYGLPNGDLDRTERHRACLTAIVDRLGELARADAQALRPLAVGLWDKVRSSGPTATDAESLIPVVAQLSRDSVASAMLPVARFDMVAGMSVDIIDIDRAAELIGYLHAGDIRPYQDAYGLDTSPTGGRG